MTKKHLAQKARKLATLLKRPVSSSALALALCFWVAGSAIIATQFSYQDLTSSNLAFTTSMPARAFRSASRVLGLQTRGDNSTTPTQVGIYFWGGQINNVSSDQNLSEGQLLAEQSGVNTLRIALSPRSDIDYGLSGNCINNFTLTGLASRPDFESLISDPQFTTVIITAYDGTTFGDCIIKNYLNTKFFSPSNIKLVEQEYTDLATFLSGFNKTFIIDTWEGDNDLYCGDAFDATPKGCPNAASRLKAYTDWVNARDAGLAAAGAPNVKSAVEFNNFGTLHAQGLPNVLDTVIPNVNPDYYSYSSYESINVSPEQLANDIDAIRAQLSADGKDPSSLIIGEAGFDTLNLGDAAAADKLSKILGVAQQENIPYIVVWNLIADPSYGAFNADGVITPYGSALTTIPSPTIPLSLAAVQGYTSTNGQYTDYFAYDNEYLILYGSFLPSGNTVYVNGLPFTPVYESANQLNVKLDSSRLPADPNNPNAQVYVSDSTGNTTGVVSFQLIPENSILFAEGFDSTTSTSTPSSATSTTPGQYLLLLGNFAPSGNMVYINGRLYKPSLETTSTIVVSLPGRPISSTKQGTSTTVYVKNGAKQTPQITVKFYAAQ